MESIINNPAGRLLTLINSGRPQQYKKETTRKVWSILLNVEEDDTQKLLKRIGYISSIPDNIEKQIKSIESLNHKVYLKYLPRVKNLLNGNLNYQSTWNTFIDNFAQPIIDNLEVCSEILSRERPEKVIENQYLDIVISDIEELLELAKSDKSSSQVNDFVTRSLLNLKNSIEEYSILGSVPIEKEIQTTIGSLVTVNINHDELIQNSKGKKLFKIVGGLIFLLGITADVKTIAPSSTIHQLLLPDQSISSVEHKNIHETVETVEK